MLAVQMAFRSSLTLSKRNVVSVMMQRRPLTQSNDLPYTPIHKPVLLREALEFLAPRTGGIYCDMTFGDGGYTRAILDSCDCKVVAVDQDPVAYEKALQLADVSQYRGRLFPLLGRFSQTHHLVQRKLQWDLPCFDGIVMDIGISSGQIETALRGFSYKLDGPLDMRMFSRGKGEKERFEEEEDLLRKSISAYEVVNYFTREQIANIIYEYGGDRQSRKIAAAIVAARKKAPIQTTAELATVIQKACPQPRWQRGDDDMLRNSAARTFQAFRIYINNELEELRAALRASEYLLRPGGRLVTVTFHSLEDRIVKTFMHHCAGRRSAQDAETNQFSIKRAAYRQQRKKTSTNVVDDDDESNDLIFIGNEKEAAAPKETIIENASLELCTKHVVRPSRQEMDENARSRSGKLRAAQRTLAPPLAPFGPLD